MNASIIKLGKGTIIKMNVLEKVAYTAGYVCGTVNKVSKVSASIIKEDYKQLTWDLKNF